MMIIIILLNQALGWANKNLEEVICERDNAKSIGAKMVDNECMIEIKGMYFRFTEENKRIKLLVEELK